MTTWQWRVIIALIKMVLMEYESKVTTFPAPKHRATFEDLEILKEALRRDELPPDTKDRGLENDFNK